MCFSKLDQYWQFLLNLWIRKTRSLDQQHPSFRQNKGQPTLRAENVHIVEPNRAWLIRGVATAAAFRIAFTIGVLGPLNSSGRCCTRSGSARPEAAGSGYRSRGACASAPPQSRGHVQAPLLHGACARSAMKGACAGAPSVVHRSSGLLRCMHPRTRWLQPLGA